MDKEITQEIKAQKRKRSIIIIVLAVVMVMGNRSYSNNQGKVFIPANNNRYDG